MGYFIVENGRGDWARYLPTRGPSRTRTHAQAHAHA